MSGPEDERTALLSAQHKASTSRETLTDPETPIQSPPAKCARSVTELLFYLVLGLVGVALLVLFIKGFIDGGDSDVSSPIALLLNMNRHQLRSST